MSSYLPSLLPPLPPPSLPSPPSLSDFDLASILSLGAVSSTINVAGTATAVNAAGEIYDLRASLFSPACKVAAATAAVVVLSVADKTQDLK